MRVIYTARKHGIDDKDAIRAATHPIWIEPLDEPDEQWRELRLGFDTKARLLETVVVCAADGDEALIHAMKARAEYTALLPTCLLYTSPSPRDKRQSRMPSSA